MKQLSTSAVLLILCSIAVLFNGCASTAGSAADVSKESSGCSPRLVSS